MTDSVNGLAVEDGQRGWSRAELQAEVDTLAALLAHERVRVLATLMDNSPAWVVADLAAAQAGVVHVPLPPFFTREQVAHALAAAQVDGLLAAAGVLPSFSAQAPTLAPLVAGQALHLIRLPARAAAIPPGTAKITFTSGTTGTPKGVCLSAAAMNAVAEGLAQGTEPLQITRHLCALPFAVLLENIAGVLAPLSRNATCVVLPLQQLGLSGSSSFDAARFDAAVRQHRPHSVILLPQMLRAWTGQLAASGQKACDSLKLVAVGGAAVGAKLLAAARAVGIPAYEGYGLSEGASVQTLNLPWADSPGSAGRPLPHAQLRVAADGELLVAGSLFNGYLGDTTPAPAWWPTGDLGEIDEDGFVFVRGRKKHVLVTAYGRNVSPEWVETALRGEPAIAQAVVFGEAQPALSAVVWPLRADTPDATLDAAVQSANASLPDYARIGHWVRARAPFSPDSGFATPNGRPQRAAIERAHADALRLDQPA